MKNILLIVLLSLAYTSFCQTKDADPTILEKLFSQEYDIKGKITQEKEGSRRELIQVGADKQNGFKKYLLTEYNADGKTTGSIYIISKKSIIKDDDLFAIKFRSYPVVSLDNVPENNKAVMKMIVKFNGEDINVIEPFAKVPIYCEEGTELCIDHYTVWYIEETGEVIEIVYEGSDCYECGGSTGGGGTSNPATPCNPSAEYPEEAEFNNHIQMRMVAASVEAPATSGETDDPIYGSFTWTVAEGVLIGWKVEAVTSYSYLHDKYYNINIGGFEHIYNILSYQTSTPYYVGTNTFITSTYTNTTTNDNILKNNTLAAHGKTEVYGRIQHVSKIEVRPPFCGPLNLDVVEEVRNTLNFFPK